MRLIFFSCNAWEDYKVRYRDSIRSVEIENVERLKKCKTSKNGYKTYKCPKCGSKKYVPFTCKCRLCTSCGTKAANQKVLFAASKITIEEMVASSNKKSKKKTELKIGMIQVLQTFGS